MKIACWMLSVAVPRASNAGDHKFVLLASPLQSTVGRIRVLVVDLLRAVASRQGLQNLGRNRFLEEQHGTVGECEVRTVGMMAEQALDIELNGNVPIVWLGPGDGGGVTSIHDEDSVARPSVIACILTASAPGKIVAGPRGVR